MSNNEIENGPELLEESGTDYPGPGEGFAEATAAHVQRHRVPSETDGYLAPQGKLRPSIRDRIAAARPYVTETVEVAEWDSTIEVRSLTLGERQDMLAALSDEDGNLDKAAIEAAYILHCSYDPDTGERVFADDDLNFIQSRAAGSADKVGQVAMRLSGSAPDKTATEQNEAEAKK